MKNLLNIKKGMKFRITESKKEYEIINILEEFILEYKLLKNPNKYTQVLVFQEFNKLVEMKRIEIIC